MLDFIMKIFDGIMSFIEYSGTIGALVGCFLILIESIFPVLPLVAFITINFLVFGKLVGFLLSWIFTILGCIISYFIFKKGFGNKFEKLTEDKATLKKYKHLFKNYSYRRKNHFHLNCENTTKNNHSSLVLSPIQTNNKKLNKIFHNNLEKISFSDKNVIAGIGSGV